MRGVVPRMNLARAQCALDEKFQSRNQLCTALEKFRGLEESA